MSWSWRKLLQIRPIVRPFFWFKIGDGFLTNAWYDNWCSASPILDRLSSSSIHNAGYYLESTVSQLLTNGVWNWPLDWSTSLSNIPAPILSNCKDEVMWKDCNGVVSTFSVSVVWESIRPRDVEVSWFSTVWFSWCIPKHAFLLWLVMKQKLKTQDMLKSWDIAMMSNQDPLLCFLCGTQADSHSHLFFECPFSSRVWKDVRSRAGLQVMSPSWNIVIQDYISMVSKRSIGSIVSRLILAASVYFIWQERNRRLFSQQIRSSQVLVDEIANTVRLKLMSIRFKKTTNVAQVMRVWKLPND